MKRYSYNRTSTREQHLDRGIVEITDYCSANIITIDGNGYRGFSWMEFYEKEGKAGVQAHSQNSFYSKKFSNKPDYMELWEERRAERKLKQQELDKEYFHRL